MKINGRKPTSDVIYRMEVAYDGTRYAGWQRQKGAMTVQQQIEEILEKVACERVCLEGASRTDSGVHAQCMVTSMKWHALQVKPIDLQRALNGMLPKDIRILNVRVARKNFHARFDAKWKLYRYRIHNMPISDPFRDAYTWWIRLPLDLRAMRVAAKKIVGKHDFTSFAVNPGYERSSMVRRIRRCAVVKRKDEVHIEVEGDGFLYKMVRTLVGTLVQVGQGRRTPDSVAELLKAMDRNLAGRTAPAKGLTLIEVTY